MKLLNTQKGLSFLGLYRTEPVAEEFALADKKPSSRKTNTNYSGVKIFPPAHVCMLITHCP